MHNVFAFFVPKENVSTIRTRDDELTVTAIKIDAFDCKAKRAGLVFAPQISLPERGNNPEIRGFFF